MNSAPVLSFISFHHLHQCPAGLWGLYVTVDTLLVVQDRITTTAENMQLDDEVTQCAVPGPQSVSESRAVETANVWWWSIGFAAALHHKLDNLIYGAYTISLLL
jgi:hypothetical protein